MYQALQLKQPEGVHIPSERTVYRVMEEIGLNHRPKRKPNGITKADKDKKTNKIVTIVCRRCKTYDDAVLVKWCQIRKQQKEAIIVICKFERLDEYIALRSIDDSLFDRSTSKKTEMLAKVFDHCSMKYKKCFRLLTLGWSDGNSFVPINHCLLSAAKDENLLCTSKQYDGRSLAARRRKQSRRKSRRKATDVMMELLQNAIKSGHQAKYVIRFSLGFISEA